MGRDLVEGAPNDGPIEVVHLQAQMLDRGRMAAMMRSLFAGVSALRNHRVRMDVIGDNIANVNTIGYKAQSVTFKEQLAQTLRGAGAPERGRGGSNPQQVGLGVDLGAIRPSTTPGAVQSTGVESDVAIEGNGFSSCQTAIRRSIPGRAY